MSGRDDTPRKKLSFADLRSQDSSAVQDDSPVRSGGDYLSAGYELSSGSATTTPGEWINSDRLVRSYSASNLSDEGEQYPPLDRLSVFDILEGLALPQHFERIQERVRRQRQRLKSTSLNAKDKVIEEWRRRVPTPDEQLDRYRRQMRGSVDRINKRWNAAKTVTAREKLSFIGGVLNIFVSGYLIGAAPQYFHYWYTAQLLYFMPIRFYTYHKVGYHYFLADLCYFVNFLLILSIWVFPNSKRLFISTFCLAFGNNAVAIAMWRNSLVFHSMDKVTSLFIHIMPCVTVHCVTHLMPAEQQKRRFSAVYNIKYSPVGSPEHYRLRDMIVWATVPYAIWQLSYHLLITVRRREKIAAGRPTSFTWLRKSYAKTFLGRFVLSLPEFLQEPAFMGIQYLYALLTILPCPLWFWSRWASAVFLMAVFTWATYNGANYYIEVFGRRMEKELEALRQEVQRWQSHAGAMDGKTGMDLGKSPSVSGMSEGSVKAKELDALPSLDVQGTNAGAVAVDDAAASTSIAPAASMAAESLTHRRE